MEHFIVHKVKTISAVVNMWSLFRRNLYNKSFKWDIKIAVAVVKWTEIVVNLGLTVKIITSTNGK
jgi:hypothetical protein